MKKLSAVGRESDLTHEVEKLEGTEHLTGLK